MMPVKKRETYFEKLRNLKLGLSLSLVLGSLHCFAAPQASNFATFREIPEWKVDFYSQTGFESKSENAVTQNRFTVPLYELPWNLRLHFGSWLETDTKSTETTIYNDNLVAPFAGIGWANHIYGVGARADVLMSYRERRAGSRLDGWNPEFRSTLYHYMMKVRGAVGMHPFYETYSEVFFRSDMAEDVFLQHWSKAGFRMAIMKRLFFDTFPELIAKADLASYDYASLLEMRAATRFLYQGQSFSSSLITSIKTPLFAGNEFYHSPFTAMLVVAAEL